MFKIRKKQLNYLGHVRRKDEMENLILRGYIKGKRRRRETKSNLIEECKLREGTAGTNDNSSQMLFRDTRKRNLWCAIIRNVLKG